MCKIALKGHKINSIVGKQLSDHYQELRSQKIKGKDALIRVLFVATRLLYQELVKELIP